LKLHGMLQQWQMYHPVFVTKTLIGKSFHRRQTRKTDKMHKRAPQRANEILRT
jgi:hypothetical protein